MLEHGILDPEERVELLDGELVHVSRHSPAHAIVVARLSQTLAIAYRDVGMIRPQLPVGGIVDSIPEPDIAVVPDDARFAQAHPVGEDTILVLEVSRSSRARDRQKAAIYARAGVAEYWRVDVGSRTVEVHTGPRADGAWAEVRIVDADGELALPLPGVEASLGLGEVFAGI